MSLHRRLLPALAFLGLPLLGAAYAHAMIAPLPVQAAVPVLGAMPAVGQPMNGVKLTVYGSGDGGACYWQTLPLPNQVPFDGFVAVGSDLWNNGLGCGRFLEVSGGTADKCGPGTIHPGPRVFMVADHCPECTNEHLDLTTPAWNAYTSHPLCILENASWREVPGAWTQDISVIPAGGSNQWWFSVLVRHHNSVLSKVEFKSAGSSSWIQADPSAVVGRWTLASMSEALVFPLSVRFTSASNEVIEASGVVTSFTGGMESDTGIQFGASNDGDESIPGGDPPENDSPPHWDRNIAITTSKDASEWWYAAAIDYANSPITKVEFKSAGGAGWMTADHGQGPNEWSVAAPQSQSLLLPLSVRLTSSYNEVIEASNVITTYNPEEVDSGIQFSASEPGEGNPSPSEEQNSSPTSKTGAVLVSLGSAKQGETLTGRVAGVGSPITMIAFRGAGAKAWKKAKLDLDTGGFKLPKANKLETPISVYVKNEKGEVATLVDLITSKTPRAKFQSRANYECPPRSRDACGKAAKAKKKAQKHQG